MHLVFDHHVQMIEIMMYDGPVGVVDSHFWN